MKKELIISSIIAVALIGIVFVTNGQSATKTTGTTSVSKSKRTPLEVKKHNNANDCWIIIKGNVYDVTSYLSAHPGGSGDVIKTCGTDATVAFNAIQRGRGHSSTAEQILPTLLVGTVQ